MGVCGTARYALSIQQALLDLLGSGHEGRDRFRGCFHQNRFVERY